jgi:diguanylate cyclase (GGDEF)-like protein
VALHWSVHQVIGYLSEISEPQDEDRAMRLAVERAAESLDAEVALIALDGEVSTCVGLGRETPSAELLTAVREGGSVEVPRLGTLHVAAWRLGYDDPTLLAVARLGVPLDAEELQLLHGMAQMLGLALRSIRTLSAARERQRLVETLLRIQRAISSRRPLTEVLETITSGASGLFERWAVSLVLVEPLGAELHLIASAHGRRHCSEETVRAVGTAAVVARTAVEEVVTQNGEDRDLLAAPVLVEGEVAGSLVADLPAEPAATHRRSELLVAFAQQVSLALTDARAMAAIRDAFYDPLTGLANRVLFLDRLHQVFSRPDPCDLTVLYIDLDGFKSVNDTFGHEVGDRVMTVVAERIRAFVGPDDTAARLGGDEFAVLLDGAGQEAGIALAERIVAALRQPFAVTESEVFIGASVGVAQRQPGCTRGAELVGWADLAMYRAKQAGRGRIVVFEPAMQVTRQRRLALQNDLHRLEDFQDFSLKFQPILRLDTVEAVGVEALVRWTHPRLGPISPAYFIPVAEETGVIRDLGRWVLTRSAEQVREWRAVASELRLNVNVSARQLIARRFPEEVAEVLTAVGLPAEALTVELTETALLVDPDAALQHLWQLRDLGVQIAMDDFGTGYSSLSHLRHFPVDEIKIDQTFVRHMSTSKEDLALVCAVINLGRTLQMRTVAEGIETRAQLDLLQGFSCVLGQGYLLSHPLDPPEVLGCFTRMPTSGTPGPVLPRPRPPADSVHQHGDTDHQHGDSVHQHGEVAGQNHRSEEHQRDVHERPTSPSR